MTPAERNNALILHDKDNIAVVIHDMSPGDPVVVNGETVLAVTEAVAAGHKVALRSLAIGDTVYRYGEPIVEATQTIDPGAHVHVHNTQPIPGGVTL